MSVRFFLALLPLFNQYVLTGQENRASIKHITDVRQGMQRKEVLAGLAEQYSLSKSVAFDYPAGQTRVLAYEKSTPEIVHSIWFLNEAVSSVEIALAPVATSGDASRLVDGLFLTLKANADPPASPSRVDMALGKESATATVEVEEVQGSVATAAGFSERRIRIVINGCTIVLKSRIDKDGKPYLTVYRLAAP